MKVTMNQMPIHMAFFIAAFSPSTVLCKDRMVTAAALGVGNTKSCLTTKWERKGTAKKRP